MRRVRFALTAAIAILQLACRTSATEVNTVATRLDALLSKLHDQQLFDGAVVVGHGPRVVWQKGFGYADVERRVPFTPDTPTDGASLAKTFTAALLIQLERDGGLNLDAPVQRYLAELPYPGITLRHLLSHSSGLPVPDYDYFDPFLPPNKVRTTADLLTVLATQKPPLLFAPGTAFQYSSFGYDLAALAAARATGRPYAELLEERLFRPLGITFAFVRPGRLSDFPSDRTRAYRRVGEKLEPNDVFDLEGFHGGSNIYISASDLHRWNASFFSNALMTKGDLGKLLSPARIGKNPSGLAVGSWYQNAAHTAYWYSGHLQGFHSEVFRDVQSGWSIVYVSNNTIAPWLQKGLVRAIADIVAGRETNVALPPTDDVPKGERNSLAGRWVLSDRQVFTVVVLNNGGLGVVHDGVSYPMFPEAGPRAFYVPGLDLVIGFRRGAGGAFSTIHVASNVADQSGTRAPE